MLTISAAQAALAAQANYNFITEQDIQSLLNGVKGATFAGLVSVTQVKTAAAHRDRVVKKVTKANVQLFNSVKDFQNVYAAAVKRSAGVDQFEVSENYFEHTNTFSLVRHKAQNKFYLYCIYNHADSLYFIDGALATKQEVAALLTPSAREQLLNPPARVHNVTNNIDHDVTVRTIALSSIVSITVQKQTQSV